MSGYDALGRRSSIGTFPGTPAEVLSDSYMSAEEADKILSMAVSMPLTEVIEKWVRNND